MKNTKRLFLSLAFIAGMTINSMAQVAVNADGSAPDNSAMLDVQSTVKGLLIPRMTSAERDLIPSPVTSLTIYQTNDTPGFYYYDGAAWVRLSAGAPGIPNPSNKIAGNLLTFDGSNWLAKTLVVGFAGGSQPFNNMQPFLALNFCIALQGIFPSMNGVEPFIGEIEIFGFWFAPQGWAMCNGQFLPINQNQALFALLGTTYGGNGQTTFALPDLRGRVPLHFGQGPGLSPYVLGEMAGTETVTLKASQMPIHNHTITYQVNP